MLILTAPEPRTKAGLVPSLINPAWTAGREDAIEGLYAEVQLDALTVAAVSKLAGEDGWTIDTLYRGSAMPVYANGYGARYLRTTKLSDYDALVLDQLITTGGE